MNKLTYYIKKVASSLGLYRYIARVVSKEKKEHSEVMEVLAAQCPSMSVRELEDLFEKYIDVVSSFVKEGYNVETIVGVISYSIGGEFKDVVDHFDSSKHQKRGSIVLNSTIKEAISKISVEKVDAPKQGPDIVMVHDGINEDAESYVVPQSGLVSVEGTEVKIVGNKEINSTDEGVYFEKENGELIKCTALVLNTPKKVIAVVPPNIEPGDYKVKILTYRFANYIHQAVLEGVSDRFVTVTTQAASNNISAE